MDESSEGRNYLTPKEKTLITRADPMGGNEREGYPKGFSATEPLQDTDLSKIKKHLPGVDHENPLMEQDPPTGDGVNNDEFTSRGEPESGGDNDVIPNTGISKSLDRGQVGPSNMQSQFFKTVRDKSRLRGLNFI